MSQPTGSHCTMYESNMCAAKIHLDLLYRPQLTKHDEAGGRPRSFLRTYSCKVVLYTTQLYHTPFSSSSQQEARLAIPLVGLLGRAAGGVRCIPTCQLLATWR